ncbi:hypothetical protein [Saccharopolyspora gloriosae]|uniref:rhamnogalacturonan lyase family protein n=1 Tax=Saccharopolyspora gloriosae TaxID=455344 RepID=UPI001FB59948|nr:hypothetical protein [Saccharopolyspora gloriosae]
MHMRHLPRNTRRAAVTASAVLAICTVLAPATGLGTATASNSAAAEARPMERLGRGVVAVRGNDTDVLVSWRLLGADPEGIGFNVYRSTDGGEYTLLNDEPLTGGTNHTDDGADLTKDNSYLVRPVVDGEEQEGSEAFTLTADHATEPVVRIPLRDGGDVKFTWVGDLDGDGEFDYVLDRQTERQSLEAYRNDGTFLWSVDMGPNSENQDNIEGGSAAINVGNWDGVTVRDLDGDGRAEVAVRVANGVVFGDGEEFTAEDDVHQSMAILDGETGAARATAEVPTDFIDDGPMGARLGVGYLDGETPSLVAFMKNRQDDGPFNCMIAAWRFDGQELTREWKWLRDEGSAEADGHNTRIVDVDGDGKDEIAEIGFVLNGDGTLRYSLGDDGIVHGDRFHIADIDPKRPGLEGYGVQQDNPSGLREYYYDAADGTMLWKHEEDGTADVGRGMAADIDPNVPGMEVWSFSGIYDARNDELVEPDPELAPWPQLGLWWDGDLTAELLNDGKFEKWDPANPTESGDLPRLLNISDHGAVNAAQGKQPTLVGDILGDWREEAVYTNAEQNELIVFTTDQPSDTRLYTLAHNPAYRNAMTLKGYLQSNHVDYFLGDGMEEPPKPNITY